MIQKFLNTQTKSISFASLILASSYLVSAVLGILRDRLLAGKFGAGNELDTYYTAFTVPDFIALILVFGAISAAIIPIFSGYLAKSEDEAWEYISALLNIFLTFLIIVCVILIIFAPLFISLITPGFSDAKKVDTILLMRIMFLSPIILGASNIISGILQVFHRFLVTALAPIMYNLGIIIGIIFFVPRFGISGLAWGVVLGGILHLLIQIPAFLHSGFKYKINFNINNPGVLKTFKLMIPRSLGLGANQFNIIAITIIGSTLASGSIAVFNLANNLSSMLVNAFAVSLSTAIFPAMSLAHSREDKKDFEKKFSGAFRQIVFLTIPASILIFILRAQIVRVVFGVGRFGWIDTRLTAACLGIFSIGLFAQGLIFILSKTFYAVHNTKIPAIISVVMVSFNISLSLFFVWMLSSPGIFFNFMQYILRLQDIKNISVVALPLSITITVIIQAFLLLFLLYKMFKTFRIKELSESLYKILISSVALFLATILTRQFLVDLNIVRLQTFWGVFLQLTLSAIMGIIFYLIVSFLLKSPELNTIKQSFFKNNKTLD